MKDTYLEVTFRHGRPARASNRGIDHGLPDIRMQPTSAVMLGGARLIQLRWPSTCARTRHGACPRMSAPPSAAVGLAGRRALALTAIPSAIRALLWAVHRDGLAANLPYRGWRHQ